MSSCRASISFLRSESDIMTWFFSWSLYRPIENSSFLIVRRAATLGLTGSQGISKYPKFKAFFKSVKVRARFQDLARGIRDSQSRSRFLRSWSVRDLFTDIETHFSVIGVVVKKLCVRHRHVSTLSQNVKFDPKITLHPKIPESLFGVLPKHTHNINQTRKFI